MPITVTPTIIKQETITADTFTIRAFRIVMPDDNSKAFLEVIIDAGITKPDTTITWLEQTMYTIDGADLLGIFTTLTTGGTIYDEIKSHLYAVCQSKGWIPLV